MPRKVSSNYLKDVSAAAVATLIVTAVVLFVPSRASAATRHCSPVVPKFELSLSANDVISCSVARDVDRYANSHEIADTVFYTGGRLWLGTIYSRAHGHTYYVFVSPGRRIGIVWVTIRIGVS